MRTQTIDCKADTTYKTFQTPTWQEPIKQDRNSGQQLFRPFVGTNQHCVNYSRFLKRTEFSNQIFVSLGDSKKSGFHSTHPTWLSPATCRPNKSPRIVRMWKCSLPILVVDLTFYKLFCGCLVVSKVRVLFISLGISKNFATTLTITRSSKVFKRIRKNLFHGAYSVF